LITTADVIVDCLTDNSDTTFVSSDRPDMTTEQLFSFQEFDDDGAATVNGTSSNNNIAYVTAQVTSKKTGASSFISFLIDRPNEEERYSTTLSISIISDSFEEKYSFTWKNNPITGEPWTIDSLNSLVAGYRYLAGQGSIQISEFKLIITSLIAQEEQEPLSPSSLSSSAIDEETSPTTEDEQSEPTKEDDNNDNDNDTNEGDSTTTAAEEEATPQR
jgi:hypothetical protein